jgi:hypothetical protein
VPGMTAHLSPVSTSSMAFDLPTARARRCVPPIPAHADVMAARQIPPTALLHWPLEDDWERARIYFKATGQSGRYQLHRQTAAEAKIKALQSPLTWGIVILDLDP